MDTTLIDFLFCPEQRPYLEYLFWTLQHGGFLFTASKPEHQRLIVEGMLVEFVGMEWSPAHTPGTEVKPLSAFSVGSIMCCSSTLSLPDPSLFTIRGSHVSASSHRAPGSTSALRPFLRLRRTPSSF